MGNRQGAPSSGAGEQARENPQGRKEATLQASVFGWDPEEVQRRIDDGVLAKRDKMQPGGVVGFECPLCFEVRPTPPQHGFPKRRCPPDLPLSAADPPFVRQFFPFLNLTACCRSCICTGSTPAPPRVAAASAPSAWAPDVSPRPPRREDCFLQIVSPLQAKMESVPSRIGRPHSLPRWTHPSLSARRRCPRCRNPAPTVGLCADPSGLAEAYDAEVRGWPPHSPSGASVTRSRATTGRDGPRRKSRASAPFPTSSTVSRARRRPLAPPPPRGQRLRPYQRGRRGSSGSPPSPSESATTLVRIPHPLPRLPQLRNAAVAARCADLPRFRAAVEQSRVEAGRDSRLRPAAAATPGAPPAATSFGARAAAGTRCAAPAAVVQLPLCAFLPLIGEGGPTQPALTRHARARPRSDREAAMIAEAIRLSLEEAHAATGDAAGSADEPTRRETPRGALDSHGG